MISFLWLAEACIYYASMDKKEYVQEEHGCLLDVCPRRSMRNSVKMTFISASSATFRGVGIVRWLCETYKCCVNRRKCLDQPPLTEGTARYQTSLPSCGIMVNKRDFGSSTRVPTLVISHMPSTAGRYCDSHRGIAFQIFDARVLRGG